MSDKLTDVAPTAALFNVAVHVVLWLLFSDPALQFRLVSAGGVVSVRFAVRVPPLRLAVITAVSSEVTPVTLAVNCAVDCPFGTVTLPGTVTWPLLSDSVTLVIEDAAAARATVQVEEPAPLKFAGEQLKELRAAGTTTGVTVMVPLPPVVVIELPAELDADAPSKLILIVPEALGLS